MWLMNYITKNSIASPNAVKGSVNRSKSTFDVLSSNEHKRIDFCYPYGMVSVPPVGEQAIVLPTDDSQVGLGVIEKSEGLSEGEVKLFSKGGAYIILKNDGRVIINGKEF